jgi:hypothetical protein
VDYFFHIPTAKQLSLTWWKRVISHLVQNSYHSFGANQLSLTLLILLGGLFFSYSYAVTLEKSSPANGNIDL